MRVRAVMAALGLLCVVAPPVTAGPTATARIDSPTDGSALTGTVDIRASGQSVAGIRRIEVLVNSWSAVSKEPPNYARDTRVDYSWDTTRLVSDGTPAPNGRYTVVVQVTSVDGDSDKAMVEVVADNPPQVPAGLRADADGPRVSVGWEANLEPDILAYVVERDSGNGFVEVGTTTAAELQQSLVPGTYAYRVTAIRASALDDDGIASTASAPVAVTVTAPTAGNSGAVTKLGRHGGPGGSDSRGGLGLSALLSNSGLPDQRGLPPIPQPPWGSYEKRLPYGRADAARSGASELASARRPGSGTLLPADGLRWVAAGLLLLVCAGLALITAVRDFAGPIAAVRRMRDAR